MNTEMGEYLVGAYLKQVNHCGFINYNVRRPDGKLAGLNEFDVLGLDLKNKTAYLCEVTTHLDGLLYKDNETTVKRISKKFVNLQDYAKVYLTDFPTQHFMFWSPVVRWSVESELQKIDGLELVINSKYAANINQLQILAKKGTNDTGNPAFRLLQILGHLRSE